MNTSNEHPQKKHSKAIINPNIKDYSNDPFFVKKANESKKTLEKYGFPEALTKRKSR